MASSMLPWATYRPFASEHHCEGDFVLANATIWLWKIILLKYLIFSIARSLIRIIKLAGPVSTCYLRVQYSITCLACVRGRIRTDVFEIYCNPNYPIYSKLKLSVSLRSDDNQVELKAGSFLVLPWRVSYLYGIATGDSVRTCAERHTGREVQELSKDKLGRFSHEPKMFEFMMQSLFTSQGVSFWCH